MSMRRIISLIESKDDAISVDWEIYKPLPDDSPEEKARFRDWGKVSLALDSAANKAVAQVVKEVTSFMKSSGLDQYDDEEEIASSIVGMISNARKKLFIPIADKYSKYGVYDGEVERQWRNVVIRRVLNAYSFRNRRLQNEILDKW